MPLIPEMDNPLQNFVVGEELLKQKTWRFSTTIEDAGFLLIPDMTIGTEVRLIVPSVVAESNMSIDLVGFPSNTTVVNLPQIKNNSLVGCACNFRFYLLLVSRNTNSIAQS